MKGTGTGDDKSELPEKSYDCGSRVGEIRDDIQASKSRFIDLVEFRSEKYLSEVEQRIVEVKESEIKNICAKTGASYLWLKHAEGRKYESEKIFSAGVGQIERLKQSYPKSVYVFINDEHLRVFMAAQIDGYSWRYFTFNFSLNFWEWVGDERYIPEIWELLKGIKKAFPDANSRIIDSKLFELAMSGEVHMSSIIAKASLKGQHWFEDIFDLRGTYGAGTGNYYEWYGEWFTKIQEYFRQCSQELQEMS